MGTISLHAIRLPWEIQPHQQRDVAMTALPIHGVGIELITGEDMVVVNRRHERCRVCEHHLILHGRLLYTLRLRQRNGLLFVLEGRSALQIAPFAQDLGNGGTTPGSQCRNLACQRGGECAFAGALCAHQGNHQAGFLYAGA